MSRYCHQNMADVCIRSDCIIKNPLSENEKYARKRIYRGCEGKVEKIRPSGSQSDITRQAS